MCSNIHRPTKRVDPKHMYCSSSRSYTAPPTIPIPRHCIFTNARVRVTSCKFVQMSDRFAVPRSSSTENFKHVKSLARHRGCKKKVSGWVEGELRYWISVWLEVRENGKSQCRMLAMGVNG